MIQYSVIDLQAEIIDPEPKIVAASSPEKAAELILGVVLFRSGVHKDLRARILASYRPTKKHGASLFSGRKPTPSLN